MERRSGNRRPEPGTRALEPRHDGPGSADPHRGNQLRRTAQRTRRLVLRRTRSPRPRPEPRGVRREAGSGAPPRSPRHGLALRPQHGCTGPPGRGDLRQDLRRLPRGGDLQAAGDEGHRVLRAPRQRRPAGGALHARPRSRRRHDHSLERTGAGLLPDQAEDLLRRRRPRVDDHGLLPG